MDMISRSSVCSPTFHRIRGSSYAETDARELQQFDVVIGRAEFESLQLPPSILQITFEIPTVYREFPFRFVNERGCFLKLFD